jgi:predicted nucleotide-binding protein
MGFRSHITRAQLRRTPKAATRNPARDQKGRLSAKALLEEQARSLAEALGYQNAEAREPSLASDEEAAAGDIFIVHGHDTQAKTELQLFLRKAGLDSVVLHEQPNGGRTIIEKFEHHARAAGLRDSALIARGHWRRCRAFCC